LEEKVSPGTGPHHVEMGQWISCAPFERLLNMTIVEACNGMATLTMPFFIDYAQGAGLMHGGALVSLADTAAAMAVKSIIAPQSHFATIELESRFLLPVKKGHCDREGRGGQPGRSAAQGEGDCLRRRWKSGPGVLLNLQDRKRYEDRGNYLQILKNLPPSERKRPSGKLRRG